MLVLLINQNPNKNVSRRPPLPEGNRKKFKKSISETYLRNILRKSGVILRHPPEKCIANKDAVTLALNVKYHIEQHDDFPSNVGELYKDLEKECENINVFKHYLFPNIVQANGEAAEHFELVSVMLLLMLSIPLIQPRLIDYLVHKTVYCADLRESGSCVQMILECFSVINKFIVERKEVTTHLTNLLGIIRDPEVKFQIVTTMPNIIKIKEMKKIFPTLKIIVQNDNELMDLILDYILEIYIDECEYERKIKRLLKKLINFSEI